MLYRNKPALFNRNKNGEFWTGQNTWLEPFFKNDLLIFGIRLYREEVFLRWLLIERAKYYKTFEIDNPQAWYVSDKEDNDRVFFSNMSE